MILTKSKKSFIILAGALSLFLFLAPNVLAGGQNCPTEGLVPCGTEGCPCEICDLFKMINRIVNYIITGIVPLIAILFVTYGGFKYITADGDPGKIKEANDVFTAAIIGLVIIYGAWMAIGFALNLIGVAEWTGLGNWYQINCP
ncbi:MAG: pilin [Candidatus Pacebacteria bacterium]|nr:pilin [Candidatus Paceibacterota bacterium]MDD4830948.1 pilin [Candidatus Paceibacterota bacterium]